MDYYRDQLETMREHYRCMRDSLQEEVNGLPKGSLSSWNYNGKLYYRQNYLEDGAMVRNSITKQEDIIRQLARKRYANAMIEQVQNVISVLDYTISNFKWFSRDEIMASLSAVYQNLPAEFFEKEYIKDIANMDPMAIISNPNVLPELRSRLWGAQPFVRSDFRPEELIHTSSRGEKLRSKSELLIAETYYNLGIEFRYEEVIKVGRYDFAPDFAFIDFEGNPFFHEHAGMMGDIKYRNRHKWKMARYEEAGIVPWKNLIITYDYDDHINMQEIHAIIDGMVKPRVMYYHGMPPERPK